MVKIEERHPVLVLGLSIITFGIYMVYWTVKTKNEINSLGGEIPTAWFMIIPIANLYFMYKYAEGFSKYVKKDDSPILWFLLWFFVPPLAVILFQMELNKLAS